MYHALDKNSGNVNIVFGYPECLLKCLTEFKEFKGHGNPVNIFYMIHSFLSNSDGSFATVLDKCRCLVLDLHFINDNCVMPKLLNSVSMMMKQIISPVILASLIGSISLN